MNVTLILGNGFDLNMGLPTAYSDFYKYYMLVDSPRSTYLIKQGIGEKPQTWADLEKSLGENSLYAPFGSPSSGGQKPSGTRGCNRPTRCSEPLRYKVGGPSKVCAMLCGLGPPGDSLLIEVTVYSKGLRQVLRDGTARGWKGCYLRIRG